MSEVSVQLRFTTLHLIYAKLKQANVSAKEVQAAIAQYQAELDE
jgi:hypothetical protein